jgi:hypothetical protein
VKPGQLQRNLSRLQAVAARAREGIGRLEGEVAELRQGLVDALATSAPGNATTPGGARSSDDADIAAGNRTRTAPVAQGGALFK